MFNIRIKVLREFLGITPQELAKLLQKNVNTIYQYESGKITPGGDVIDRLCNTFKIKPTQFFNLDKIKIVNINTEPSIIPEELEPVS